jgi:transcriptional regulator with XRE-family HTH domain
MRLDDWFAEVELDENYLRVEEALKPRLNLGDDILAARLRAGWSQKELAERVGTRQANISRLESGLANPTWQLLQRVARALDCQLTVRLEPKPAETRGLQYDLGASDTVTLTAVAAPGWPRRMTGCAAMWDDRALDSSAQAKAEAG